MLFHEIRQRITEELFARRIDRWVTGAIAALLVALGFIAGRWTSLTSNATPIVFQEAPAQEVSGQKSGVGSEASAQELKALVEEPRAPQQLPETATRGARTESPSPRPVVQGASTGAFVASANGEKYYFPDCSEVRRIKEENKIWFDSQDEARASGYEPSACVQRRAGQ